MNQTKKKLSYLKIGKMCQKKEVGADGKPAYYLKLNEGVQITVNGQTYTGGYVNVQRPEQRLAGVLKSKKIDETEYNKEVERYGKGGELEYIKFEFIAVKED